MFFICVTREDFVRKSGDEKSQTLNISVFYTLMKQALWLHAQEQGYPVSVVHIKEVNQPKTPLMDIGILAILRTREEARYDN